MEQLEAYRNDGDWPAAYRELFTRVRDVDSYAELASLAKWRKRLRRESGVEPEGLLPVRIALLGNATTSFLAPHLALMLEAYGIAPELHEAGYDSVAWEFFTKDSSTATFGPQVCLVTQSPIPWGDWPDLGASVEEVDHWVEKRCAGLLAAYASANTILGCDIVADTYHPLPLRPHGNLGTTIAADRNRVLRGVNAALAGGAPGYVHLHDVEALASHHGVGRWVDWRLWFQAKQPMSFDSMVPYTRSLARVTASLFRGSKKCLVLDLDNTLWGGVVGDDGVDGIAIGAGDPLGEAFVAFQDYVRQLKARGILLAVCSKNEERNARAPFEERPDMLLSLDDFAAFRANWDPKPDNLRAIATALNLGLDAMVFVDDNPAERAIVRQMLPEVAVVELTDDPADYPHLLDATGWFETTAVSAEDADRTRQYQANAERDRSREEAPDYDTYLRSLDQKVVIRPFDERHLDRITQLVNKTNQFNLTTRRQNRSEIAGRMTSDDYLTAYVRLADRFGDNGLISVWYGHCEGTTLTIEQWLMSCRVFNRGVEGLLMNYIVAEARARGISTIRGEYIPTEKNGLVADLYERLGFTRDPGADNGRTQWTLAVDRFSPTEVAIDVVDDY